MAEIINLRNARKQAKRRQESKLADSARIAHGVPPSVRKLAAQLDEKTDRLLDGHRIEPGEGQ